MEMLRNYNLNGAKEEMAGAGQTPPVTIRIMDNSIGYIRLYACRKKTAVILSVTAVFITLLFTCLWTVIFRCKNS
jgi:hypothetical protein